MSNSLEFSINAKDNTSKVVDTVNKKINSFGTDLAKMALGVAGPMALVQAGISAIGNAIEEYKQKVAEAIKFGSELPNQAKALNISVEEYQRLGSAAEAAGVGIDTVAQAYVEVRKAIDAAKDPTSSQAAALQALGFAAADIASGAIKPIEVIERLGRAMATGADDATQFKIASGLLGTSVEKLIPILRKAQEATQGYTDAGDILSEEEAAILRESEMETKKKELNEKVEKARESARDKIFKGKGGAERQKIAEELFPTLSEKEFNAKVAAGEINQRNYSRTFNYKDGYRQEDTYEILRLGSYERDLIIKEYAAREQARKKAEADAKAAADKEAADKLKAIADEAAAKKQKEKETADAAKEKEKADADAAKEKEKADADAAKIAADKEKQKKDELGKALDAEAKAADSVKFTGSSLRDIGGALAGEAMTSGIDYQAAALDISQKILIELQKLNIKTLPEVPDTNFTKPTRVGGTFTA
jgi:chemotaxis protein histidine kinase CheA